MPNFFLISTLLGFLVITSTFESSFASTCNKTALRHSNEGSSPLITYYRDGSIAIDSSSPAYSEYTNLFDGQELISPLESRLGVWLICNHTRPVKWVCDSNKAEESSVDFHTYTYREVLNYSDLSNQRFTAVARIIIEPGHRSPVILICEDIHDSCNSRVVLVSPNVSSDSLVLQNNNYPEMISNQFVKDFEKQRKNVENFRREDNNSCPFLLSLYYIPDEAGYPGHLAYVWNKGSDTASSIIFPTFALMTENHYRLTPSMAEHCVNRTYLNSTTALNSACPTCLFYNFGEEGRGYPYVIFYNRAGNDRRVFRVHFDLQLQTMRNMSEQANNEDLTQITNTEESSTTLEFFKGEIISFRCAASIAKFSVGVIVLWGFPGEGINDGIALNDDVTKINFEGAASSLVNFPISKQLLDAKNSSKLNITCLFPVWNTTEWVGRSSTVHLKESAYPSATLLDKSSLTDPDSAIQNGSKKYLNPGQKFIFSCVGQGIPLPDLKLHAEKQNLDYNVSEIKTDSSTISTIRFENVDSSYAGTYRCLVKNVVGETYVSFEISVQTALSGFKLAMIITSCIAFAAFIIVSAILLVKYRMERADFRKKTLEAIERFDDGFKDMKSITFISNAECNNFELPLVNWKFGGTVIGEGAFGKVHKGFIRKGEVNILVAVKIVQSPKDVTEFESSLKELLIMAYIGDHPNVIGLLAACRDKIAERSLLLATEYCPNGDLLSFMRKNQTFFCMEGKSATSINSEDNALSYLNIEDKDNRSFCILDLNVWSLQIADGMSFLESKKVLHGDLAARNILLNEHKIAKISDFGLSRQLTDDDNYTKKTSCPLPWKWMALESMQYRVFSSKSDVWALGVTLYEIFSTGCEPWPFLSWTIEFVDELERGRRPAKPQFATKEMYEKVMLECWRNEPGDRPSFEEIKLYFEPFARPQG